MARLSISSLSGNKTGKRPLEHKQKQKDIQDTLFIRQKKQKPARRSRMSVSIDDTTSANKPTQKVLYKKEVRRIKRDIRKVQEMGYEGFNPSSVKIPKTLKGAKNFNRYKIFRQGIKETEYEKEYLRVTRALKRLEDKGYETDNFIIPKDTDSIKRLKGKKIYEQLTFELSDGTILTGIEARRIFNSIAGEKVYKTRKQNAEIKRIEDEEEAKRAKEVADIINKQNLPKKSDIIIGNLLSRFVDEDQIYNVLNMLKYGDTSWAMKVNGVIVSPRQTRVEQVAEEARIKLLDLLENEIRTVGMDTVARRVEESANGGDLVPLIEGILHGYDSDEDVNIRGIQASYQEVVGIIKGTSLSGDDREEWSDYDSDEESMFNE